MESLLKLKELTGRIFTDKAGDQHQIELLPGLSNEQIELFKLSFRQQTLPAEIEEVMRFTGGFTFYDGTFTLKFNTISPEKEKLTPFPDYFPIAFDKKGNYWCVEINDKGEWGSVYYFSFFPQAMILQSTTLAGFFEDIIDFGENWENSRLETVHSRRTYEVVRDNEGILDYQTAISLSDHQLREFATSFPTSTLFADLRKKLPMSGINLEYVTGMRKHPSGLFWALELKKPERSFIERIFKI